MNKSPFYSIRLKNTQEDITDLVTGFVYEDAVDKDDLLRLQVKQKKAVELIESGFLAIGQELIFSFGYIGSLQSLQRIARVTSNSVTFGQQIKYEVVATDLGLLMKKDQQDDDWTGLTSSEIAQQIATRNGFIPNIEPTAKRHSIMLQGGKTDFQFLKYLASIEGQGFRFFISGQTLNFTKRNLLKPSARSFNYNSGKGWISFKISEKDNTKDAGSKLTQFRNVDPATGIVNAATSQPATSTEGKLGDFSIHYNDRGEEQFTKPSVAARAQKTTKGKTVLGGSQSTLTDALGSSDNYQRMAALKDVNGDLSLILSPTLTSDQVITIEGIPQKYSGNWYVQTVVHNIGESSASTTLKLNRNASNLKDTRGGNNQNTPSTVNKSVGKRTDDNKKELVVVDGNGNIQFELGG